MAKLTSYYCCDKFKERKACLDFFQDEGTWNFWIMNEKVPFEYCPFCGAHVGWQS